MKNLPNYLLLLLVVLSPPAPAQDGVTFPEERLRELREEVRFEEPEREEPRETDFEPIDWTPYRTPVLVTLGVVFAVGLSLLLYRLFRDLRPGQGARSEFSAVPVEAGEIVEERIVAGGVSPELLQRAEGAGQYDVAIRLLYLSLLKELQDAGLIRWRRDFSNRDYRLQLTGHPIAPEFQNSTEFYERYWYGKYPVDRLSYRVVRTRMDELQTEIAALASASPTP